MTKGLLLFPQGTSPFMALLGHRPVAHVAVEKSALTPFQIVSLSRDDAPT